MTEEDLFLQKRFMDLANRCYQNNQYTFSGFLSMMEQELLFQILPQIRGIDYAMSGGTDSAERKIIRFGSEEMFGYIEDFPIRCIEIKPVLAKFSDELTHRDFLGALMNLGIERNLLGDIYLKDNCGYLFCQDRIADYIIENLDKVKHTSMKCQIIENIDKMPKPEMISLNLIVSSFRLDGIVAKLCHLSRKDGLKLFEAKKVFINGRCTENNSADIKAGDFISVRGFGKFCFSGIAKETKKEKSVL